MNTKDVISLKNISKSFTGKRVLTDISFCIPEGSLTGIEGENGSGKTTLLNILAGYWSADSGSLKLDGRIGFCPQTPMIFMQLSAIENIRLFSQAYGLGVKKGKNNYSDRIEELREIFRYTDPLSKKCFTLSGGTLQKLNLMIALLHEPDVLLLDEPYTAFDWETYQAFWKYALDLKKKGRTILIISHIVYDRDKFDKIITLKNGRII